MKFLFPSTAGAVVGAAKVVAPRAAQVQAAPTVLPHATPAAATAHDEVNRKMVKSRWAMGELGYFRNNEK